MHLPSGVRTRSSRVRHGACYSRGTPLVPLASRIRSAPDTKCAVTCRSTVLSTTCGASPDSVRNHRADLGPTSFCTKGRMTTDSNRFFEVLKKRHAMPMMPRTKLLHKIDRRFRRMLWHGSVDTSRLGIVELYYPERIASLEPIRSSSEG